MKQLTASLLLLAALAAPGRAWELSDHERVTRRAVAEFNACYPGAFDARAVMDNLRPRIKYPEPKA